MSPSEHMQSSCISPGGLLGLLAIALGCTACAGEVGTLSVTLTQAPGSTLLDSVQTLRMTLTNPLEVTMAQRTPSGFTLSLELPASGDTASVLVEGFDAGGALVANGASPQFPLGAINGRIVIYMAPPLSVGAAPLSLTPARSELAIAALPPYGAIVAGGRLDSGAPSDAVSVYNAFDHSLVAGKELPEARAGLALGVGTGNGAYMFGGLDAAGVPTANLWRFDTNAKPNGAYLDYGVKDGFARAGQLALPIGNDRFLITGSPVAEIAGLDGTTVARTEVTALPAAGVSLVASDGMPATMFAGPDGVVRFRTNAFTTLAIPEAARANSTVVEVPAGKVLVVCGTTDAVRIDAATGAAEVLPGIPAVAKTGCAAAATTRFLIIAGGTTSAGIDGNVTVYDASTLALVATVPLVVPRTNAVALALPNGQILIAGGVDAAGAPVGTLELFTPPVN